MSLVLLVFWLSVATILYAYAGFPLLLVALAAIRGRNAVRQAPITPRVSIVIAAYNEADVIAARLENALALGYPRAALEIIVASDGSSDDTAEIAARFADRGVRVLRLPRQGKIAALDAAVRSATGEILVFSDADTFCEPDALRAIVRNFADPAVGGVIGRIAFRVRAGSESSSQGERLYWRYDSWLKQLEHRAAGSVVSAAGSLYALRRELYAAPPDGAVTDDFTISTGIIAAGKRLVFEPDARAWAVAVPRARQEFARRVRLMTRGLRAIALRRALLNPFRFGAYSICLFSHKVVRRLVPVALIALLLSSIALAGTGTTYLGAATLQLLFYSSAAAGGMMRRTRIGKLRLLYIPFFFCVANAAALIALLRFVRGDRIAHWQPQRTAVGAD